MRWLYSMISSYLICGLISFYLWSYLFLFILSLALLYDSILSYLEALFYSWRTSSILLVFGLVDIIIRFKGEHMVNTCQTHVCYMLSTCTTVQYCTMLCAQPFLLYYSFFLFNLHSLFISLTNHAFHLLIFVIPAYFLLSSLLLIVCAYLIASSI